MRAKSSKQRCPALCILGNLFVTVLKSTDGTGTLPHNSVLLQKKNFAHFGKNIFDDFMR